MARIARVVAPHFPHHIVQRGNRRQKIFFCDQDYETYMDLLSYWCSKSNVEIWAYCLMSNHVHLVAVPETADGLRCAISQTHRRYTRHINFREGWRGHLWQERFSSYPMDEKYLLAAARYIELNPVHAGIVARPEQYRWSSAAAHLHRNWDKLLKNRPLLNLVSDWPAFLSESNPKNETELLSRHENTGKPLGDESFIHRLEATLHRNLRAKKPGPKPALHVN